MDIKLLFRILLTMAGMGLASLYPVAPGGADRRRMRLLTLLLAVCAVLALYFHLELGPQFRRVSPAQIMNQHDFYHYYVGAKYHEELGYFDLYECTVVADWDSLRVRGSEWVIRDLHTYRYRSMVEVGGAPERCRGLFTDERWASFRSDVGYFSRSMSDIDWKQVFLDKGYNATPVWNAAAAVVTNLLPLSSTAGLMAMLGLDYLYLLVLLGAVALAFGWRNGLFVALFWGVNVMATTTFVKGSLSRTDWLLCLVGALCLLKRRHYASAGVLAAVATTSRVFPVLFFIGLFFKFLWSAIRTRSVPGRYLRFGAAMFLTVGLLVGATARTPGGRADWADFATKIRLHDEQIASYRVGFKYAVIDSISKSWVEKERQWQGRKPFYWMATALALALVLLASGRVQDHQTMALSFVCVFFLTAPTFYYYQDLVIPFAMFLPDPRRPGLMFGMSAFFGWCMVGYGLRMMWPLGVALTHWLSWSLVALCVVILAQALLVFRGEGRAAGDPLVA